MKKFFYACAALLCLALAFHFGATSAQSQMPGQVRIVGELGWFATDTDIWVISQHGWQPLTPGYRPAPPVPTSQVLWYLQDGRLVTVSGEGFWWNGSGWTSVGTIPGGPTQATQESWGQLKARYR